MNNTQKKILIIYAAIIVLMIIFPPYILEIKGYRVMNEYSAIWHPVEKSDMYGVINHMKLLIQMLGATLIAVALVFAFKSKT